MTASLANHLLGFRAARRPAHPQGAPWERLAGLDPWLLLGGCWGAVRRHQQLGHRSDRRPGLRPAHRHGPAGGGRLLDALAGRLAASDLLGILLVLAGAALQRWQGGKSRSRG